jgi:hypothetical protein
MRSGSLVVVLVLTVCAGAAAQQRVRNPHGKLEEECAFCHNADGWSPARVSTRFDHGSKGLCFRERMDGRRAARVTRLSIFAARRVPARRVTKTFIAASSASSARAVTRRGVSSTAR